MLSPTDWISGTDPIYDDLSNLPPTSQAVRLYGNTKGFRKLSPLQSLKKLSRLDLFAKVQDSSLAPLKGIPDLSKLDMWVLEKGYHLEELAVAAAIAPNLLDKWLDFQPWGTDCKKCGTTKLTLIGRGIRSFCPVCQPNRGEKFTAAFTTMVNRKANE